MSKYKNVGEIEQTVPGVGLVKVGETVEIDENKADSVDLSNFNNANFVLVGKATSYKKVDEEEEES